jgi:putative toxin-antitoxin system antitoxin component (TIGR02293 family)
MERKSVEDLLGLQRKENHAAPGKWIRKGLSTRCLKNFQNITAASEEEIRQILWLSPELLKARMCEGRLKTAESDRLYRAASFIHTALIHFKGDEGSVRIWLRSPVSGDNPILPITILGTEGGVELAEHFLRGSYFELYLIEGRQSGEKKKEYQEKYTDPLSILGLRRPKNIDDKIRGGFPFRSYELFQKRTLLSAREMHEIIWLSSRAISKFRAESRLSADASDRLYRAAVVFYFVNLMLGLDARETYDWMHYKDPWLGSRRPIDLLGTYPEADEVKAMACRIMDGMVV